MDDCSLFRSSFAQPEKKKKKKKKKKGGEEAVFKHHRLALQNEDVTNVLFLERILCIEVACL